MSGVESAGLQLLESVERIAGLRRLRLSQRSYCSRLQELLIQIP